jgi:hypothetical protein
MTVKTKTPNLVSNSKMQIWFIVSTQIPSKRVAPERDSNLICSSIFYLRGYLEEKRIKVA